MIKLLTLGSLLIVCACQGVADDQSVVAKSHVGANGAFQGAANEGQKIIGKANNFVTVRGVLVSRANGVECAKIKDSDGRLIGVSSIPHDVDIGERVTLKGKFAIMTRCRGEVLVVDAPQRG